MKKTSFVAVAVAAGVALGGMGVSPALAASVSEPQSASIAQPENAVAEITADQWKEIAASAKAAGDSTSAEAALDAAHVASLPKTAAADAIETQGWGVIAKMAVKAALKYGTPFLPDYIKPIADKLYDLMDKIGTPTDQEFVELLMEQGVDANNARLISKWVHTFI